MVHTFFSSGSSISLGTDECSVCRAATPPPMVTDVQEQSDIPEPVQKSDASIPYPGGTFIIRSVEDGRVLSLLDGQVMLERPGGRASIHWQCVDTAGWLGFRNTVSGTFLGQDMGGTLCCSAKEHKGWESFNLRPCRDGGYDLLLSHWKALRRVGLRPGSAEEKLTRLEEDGKGAVRWEFIEV